MYLLEMKPNKIMLCCFISCSYHFFIIHVICYIINYFNKINLCTYCKHIIFRIVAITGGNIIIPIWM